VLDSRSRVIQWCSVFHSHVSLGMAAMAWKIKSRPLSDLSYRSIANNDCNWHICRTHFSKGRARPDHQPDDACRANAGAAGDRGAARMKTRERALPGRPALWPQRGPSGSLAWSGGLSHHCRPGGRLHALVLARAARQRGERERQVIVDGDHKTIRRRERRRPRRRSCRTSPPLRSCPSPI
jgi:hypothetical protein